MSKRLLTLSWQIKWDRAPQ